MSGQRFLRRLVRLGPLALGVGCNLGDLVNTPHASPTAPGSLAQVKSDGATVIGVGGATDEPTVLVTAVVTDPDAQDQLTLEVEFRPLAEVFANTATHTGTAAPNGAVTSVVVAGLAENTGYHWQVRSVDQTGRASPWVKFGGNAEAEADCQVDAIADLPASPAGLTQLKSDGMTAIAVGATTDETTVIFRAGLSDSDPGDSIRLEIERQPVSTNFTGTPTATSSRVPSGGTASITSTDNLANVSYHWAARAIDRTGLASPWVSFGGNPEVQPDYRVDPPEPPNPPTSLGQFRQNGQTVIAVGDSTDQTTVVFKGTVTDPDLADQVRLEVEVRPVGVSFTNTATAVSALVANGASPPPQVSVSGLATATNYHWQARAVDQTGRASAWVDFGTNGEATDFRVR